MYLFVLKGKTSSRDVKQNVEEVAFIPFSKLTTHFFPNKNWIMTAGRPAASHSHVVKVTACVKAECGHINKDTYICSEVT